MPPPPAMLLPGVASGRAAVPCPAVGREIAPPLPPLLLLDPGYGQTAAPCPCSAVSAEIGGGEAHAPHAPPPHVAAAPFPVLWCQWRNLGGKGAHTYPPQVYYQITNNYYNKLTDISRNMWTPCQMRELLCCLIPIMSIT